MPNLIEGGNASESAKAIAFYLPQFHPIRENDEWWGPGFTDWRNVVGATPRFRGHYQPHIPADLGFYDLRLAETREYQAELAARFGVHGFCYYHYWFAGKRILEKPFDDVLRLGRPGLPFSLCWANESWSRTWSGQEHDVLLKQTYSSEDDFRHFEWLQNAFCDSRYIRVKERPLFLIYRPDSLPSAKRFIDSWREWCARAGVNDPYICGVRSGFSLRTSEEWRADGFDRELEFQPNRELFPASTNLMGSIVRLLRGRLSASTYGKLAKLERLAGSKLNSVIDYKELVRSCQTRLKGEGSNAFPCVFPSWDNCARRSSATIIQNLDTKAYEDWLRSAVASVQRFDESERFVFINAWNEWAEGCHLEPDLRLGHGFLESTRAALQR